MKIWPNLSCRDAAHLITENLDRPLSFAERGALRLHLAICSACPIVIRQMQQIRDGIRAWRDANES
jgi:Putative zinc-finger